ncbi:lipid II flippase MurJ [Phycicoccus sp. HDW14]|uniref:lipid II flippase MurJ n=1 Tax=Phycicoccus sp. HDW14 TaxID=2714941 RepID=UPI002110DCB7|nr:lipid II flippase MurJ [Phycicoccus sp. HDW14]
MGPRGARAPGRRPLARGPLLSGWLIDDFDPRAHDVGTTLLRIFAVQVPLYGVGIILTGLLQAHRRFLAAALAPLVSSVVVLGSYLWYGRLADGAVSPSVVDGGAIAVLGWGTTLGVVVLSLPLVVPALGTGWRWRPALRMEREDAVRIGALAGAGVLALGAQQVAVLVTVWLTNHSGTGGAFTVYQYVQAVYLLPYAVLAVPVAVSAFPALAASTGAGEDSSATLARALRAVLVLTGLAAGVLVAAAPAVGGFFTVLDARRGSEGASPEALAALAPALTSYAPGVIGFGVTALLTRALYVRGRPLDAAWAVGLGWAMAALVPLALVGSGKGADTTLRMLGITSTLGMTASAVLLVMLVRRSWGPEVSRGLARTAGALVVALALSLVVGDLVTRGRTYDGLLDAVGWGVLAGVAALVAGLLAVFYGDRRMMGEIRDRGRARRRGGSAG